MQRLKQRSHGGGGIGVVCTAGNRHVIVTDPRDSAVSEGREGGYGVDSRIVGDRLEG